MSTLICPFKEKLIDRTVTRDNQFRQLGQLPVCSNCAGINFTVFDSNKPCPHDSEIVYKELETYKPVIEGLATFKGNPMNGEQVRAERSKRNDKHWVEQVLPTLPKDDQLYHAKKEGLKLGSDGQR